MANTGLNKLDWIGFSRVALIGKSVMGRFALPVLLAGAILFFDISFPLGVAGGVPYVAMVLLGLMSSQKNDIFIFAAIGSVLIIVGYFLSAEGGILWMVATNRGLALFAIWITAILCYRQNDTQSELEKAVDARTRELGNSNLELAGEITERTAAQAALRESEERYRTLADQIPNGIFVHCDEKLVYANPACIKFLQVESLEQIIGIDPIDFIHPDERDKVLKRRALVAAGHPGVQTIEINYLFSNGTAALVETRAARINWGGKQAHLIILNDITEQREREAQLRQAQKMAAVGQLTGGVAHDFNNLLTVVMGNLELAQDRLTTGGDVAPLLERAQDGATRGATLTHRLLAFSRKQALEPQIIDARDLVLGMTDLLRRTLQESIEIEFMGGDELWRCEADPSQLENALLNLAINARDAMSGRGKLTIETGNVSLSDDYAAAQSELEPGQYVMVAVTDTGSGMPQEVIDQAFDPFFTTKDVGAGSGLGLSMVYGFVKQSGGHVTIYSEVGVGTTVKIYLPRTEAPAGNLPHADATATPRARGETILVVEDDPAVLMLSVTLLRDLGYEVLAAADANSALRALENSSRINLLFTDVILPGGMNGPDLAIEARRQRPGIGVLYTSGYTENAIFHQGRLDEGVELLNKPFKKADLAQKIRAVLDKSEL